MMERTKGKNMHGTKGPSKYSKLNETIRKLEMKLGYANTRNDTLIRFQKAVIAAPVIQRIAFLFTRNIKRWKYDQS